MQEIWKFIPGWEGYYEVSNLGNVRSIQRTVIGKKKVYKTKPTSLRKSKNRKGYCFVKLYKNRTLKTRAVHRLVMLAFIGPSELQVDHINGIKDDNRLENLEYVSNRENTIRSYKRSLNKKLPTGVHKDKNSYVAKLTIKSKSYHLGSYKTPEEAEAQYKLAISDIDNIHIYHKKQKNMCK